MFSNIFPPNLLIFVSSNLLVLDFFLFFWLLFSGSPFSGCLLRLRVHLEPGFQGRDHGFPGSHIIKQHHVNFEAAIDSDRSLYEYLNIRFGGTYNMEGHEHSVSLALASDADGKCPICKYYMKSDIIVKCLKCKLHAVHWECCERL
ncbi:hypothetical protein Tco_0903079 [Tanacetum coccineum]